MRVFIVNKIYRTTFEYIAVVVDGPKIEVITALCGMHVENLTCTVGGAAKWICNCYTYGNNIGLPLLSTCLQ